VKVTYCALRFPEGSYVLDKAGSPVLYPPSLPHSREGVERVPIEVEIPDPPTPFRFETTAHVLILHNGSPMMDPTKPGIPSLYMAGYVPIDPARLLRVRVTITEIPDEEGDPNA
jgi:hypothetical protein